jgi:hypothetical protein
MSQKFVLLIAAFLIAAIVALALSSQRASAHEGRELAGTELVIGFTTEPPLEGAPNGISLVFTREAGASEVAPAAGDAVIDVVGHGAVFGSGTLEPGQSFEYVPGDEMNGLTIPFHNHLNHDAVGEIHVTASAPEVDSVTVEVHSDEYHPSNVMVRAGTSIVFTNGANTVQTVVSGLASSPAATVPVLGLQDTLKIEITHVETEKSQVMSIEPKFGAPGGYEAALIPTAPGQYKVRVFGTIDGTAIDEEFISGSGTFDDVISAESVQFPNRLGAAREVEQATRGALTAANEGQEIARDADSAASTATLLAIVGIILGLLGLGAGGYAIVSNRN